MAENTRVSPKYQGSGPHRAGMSRNAMPATIAPSNHGQRCRCHSPAPRPKYPTSTTASTNGSCGAVAGALAHEQADAQLATRSAECAEMLDRLLKVRSNIEQEKGGPGSIAFS